MNTLFKLEIPKRSLQCASQGERLQPGMEIYSLLIEDEHQRFTRKDFCLSCWSKLQAEGIVQPNQGYWKSKIEEKRVPVESSRIERALQLLRGMVQSQQSSESDEAEIFVLCLYLAHARQLVLRKELVRDGAPYQLYEVLHCDEFITIKVKTLSMAEIDTIQKALAMKLHQPQEAGIASVDGP